ncbi:MAG: YajQ family cyclic di-GMP-binding protein [Polyangiaceae bacterium]|nr:YajQ family cyclic di-GMP-binding protein [Polyangiaceae bacterium]MCK6534530.1 YajQ family cyclic di-GMP-binding protein [Polyangiaceae bacterium]
MPSFDVVSKVAWAEVTNALDQASREVGQRFDFKDTETSLEKTEEGIVVRANSEERAQAAVGVLQEKLIRRKVSLKHLDVGDPTPGPKGSARILVKIKEGIEQDKAKQVLKLLKDKKLKVQASIQGDSVRITGKKKDDLQEVIALLRAEDFGIVLSFENFRD